MLNFIHDDFSVAAVVNVALSSKWDDFNVCWWLLGVIWALLTLCLRYFDKFQYKNDIYTTHNDGWVIFCLRLLLLPFVHCISLLRWSPCEVDRFVVLDSSVWLRRMLICSLRKIACGNFCLGFPFFTQVRCVRIECVSIRSDFGGSVRARYDCTLNWCVGDLVRLHARRRNRQRNGKLNSLSLCCLCWQ